MPERGYEDHAPSGEASVRMTNEDFRKLMMTPRVGFGSSGTSTNLGGGSARAGNVSVRKSHQHKNSEHKRAKKSEYLKERQEEEEILAELAKKYRDRAKERREGDNSGGPDALTTLGAYRAVAPDIKSTMDAAERRKQMIQESKFLGGDMEHTHLVKGLDYALLQKVRSEIEQQEEEEDEQLEEAADGKKNVDKDSEKKKDGEEEIQFKTIIGKNIYRTVFMSKPPERNELFLPGRMAYLIELEDENAESDIPTTVLRSKADCPGLETQATLSTNDIVINKLTQILSYLRQGKAGKKIKKTKENKDMPPPAIPGLKVNKTVIEDSIYGNIGTYVPSAKEKSLTDSRRSEKHNYFDDHSRRDKSEGEYSRATESKSATLLEAERTLGALLKPGASDGKQPDGNSKKAEKILSKLSAEPEGYAECYPGFEEMNDALEDSDDEADYSKMDMGNKKGPVGRWDFDTAEEYGEYMNSKEALPKAAYQYGIKMADGRKTRSKAPAKSEKSEKAELDREWQKIQSILHKRKSGPTSDSERPEKSARR